MAKENQKPRGRKPDPHSWTNFTLRIRNDMLTGIDRVLEETVGISKTGWILQAIQEKLKKSKVE